MVWTRLAALAGLFALLSVAANQAAAPPRKGNGKGKGNAREQIFRGVITDVNLGKNRKDEAGSITVRGHDGRDNYKARPGKGKALQPVKAEVAKGNKGGKGGKGGKNAGRETMTFQVGDKTLVVRSSRGGPGKGKRGPGKVGVGPGKGGKGRGQFLTIRQLREGDIVEVSHLGNRALEVRVVGHMGGPGDGKGKGPGKRGPKK